MESVLSETPDQVLLGKRAGRVISKGAKIKANRVDSLSSDAIPFYIDDAAKVIVFSQYKEIHGKMEYILSSAAIVAKNDADSVHSIPKPNKFDKRFKLETMFGCAGLQMYSYKDTLIFFYGIKENSIDGIKEYLIDNFEKLDNLYMRTFVKGKEGAKELCGRIWTHNNVISFWNEKPKVDPYMDLVLQFIRKIGMNPNECAYEFLEGTELLGRDDLVRDISNIEKISKEEMRDLLKIQHLDPNAKKQLYIRGMEEPETVVTEKIIKLKDLIQ